MQAYNDCKPNWITNAGLLVGDHYHTYITALYWALSTMTTVGYGDVVPGSPMEQIASMVGMGIGVSLFSYLIGVCLRIGQHVHRAATAQTHW